MIVLQTERLVLRRLTADCDAEFILRLLNEPSFLRFIGDKGVRTLEDARQYILNGPVASYEKNGFGLYLVQLKGTLAPIGICGLIKRENLPDIDIGFAFLPEFWNKGYCSEAAVGTLAYGRDVLKINRIVAIADPQNEASARVLEKLGLRLERTFRFPEGGPEINLFAPPAVQ